MTKGLKLFLLALLAIPLAIGLFPVALMINAFLGGISYNLLVYHHKLDWGAESLIGSTAIWAVVMSLIICLVVAIREIKK